MIAPGETAQAPAIAALFREAFPERLRPYMVYAQAGASSVIAESIQHPDPDRPHHFLVAEVNDQIIASADFITSGERASLAYIAVHPAQRGRGVAGALIERFVSASSDPTTLDLEVFHDNDSALSLYRRLGFTPTGSRSWVRRPIPAMGHEVFIPSVVQVRAARGVLGFCEFEAHVGSDVRRFSAVGPGIRCPDAEQFADGHKLGGIAARLGDVEYAFAIIESNEVAAVVDHDVLTISQKMELPL